jgi:hypothetical protein
MPSWNRDKLIASKLNTAATIITTLKGIVWGKYLTPPSRPTSCGESLMMLFLSKLNSYLEAFSVPKMSPWARNH